MINPTVLQYGRIWLEYSIRIEFGKPPIKQATQHYDVDCEPPDRYILQVKALKY